MPNELDKLIEDSHWAISTFNDVQGINIPDILRVKNRSYNIVPHLSKQSINNIPHIRICDFKLEALMDLCENLLKKNVVNVLLISGDPPPNPLQPIYKHNIIQVIYKIKTNYPQLNIYGGFDPYRQSLKKEYEYALEKIEAGAKGLFTQPVFDINLAKLILNLKINCEWFIGVSPVLTEKSLNYWISRNNVVFPASFKPSFEYNVKLGKEIIQICKDLNQNNYLMPIKTDINQYLNKLFNG